MSDSIPGNQVLADPDSRASIRGWNPTYGRRTKRFGDIILVFGLLPVALPVIAIMYLIARIDGGPAFFGHVRIGKGGKVFKCWKIRTMVPNSGKCLTALLQSDPIARAEWDEHRKLRNDPRVTRFGHFLRQSSLDELPQLWNVLRGDMSMVGPRPVTREELLRYRAGKRAYLALQPGITGLWQVSGRNDVTYDERVQYDVRYFQNMSFALDIKILIQTARVMIKRNGM